MNIQSFVDTFSLIRAEVAKAVVGQTELIDGVLVGAICGGHVLVEGAPGLGKTLVARAFAIASGATFKRIQFTPDLMPSDITGSTIFDRQSSEFRFIAGPIFTELLLADEVNRAPAKTQSALLEAMQDRQVTIDGTSRPLPELFYVLATQNPVESQGTYPLPEAQLDRFLMKLLVEDPAKDEEAAIVRNHARGFDPTTLSGLASVVTPKTLMDLRALSRSVRIDDAVVSYIVEIVRRTREDRGIELGASPRASLALLRVSQVMAASMGRDFVTPDDVKPMALPVLRHRIMLHPDVQLQGTTPDACIAEILRNVPVPRLL